MAQRNWAVLTLDEQRRIANLYREGGEGAVSIDAAELNTTPASLSRTCRYFLYYERQFLGAGALAEGEDHAPFDSIDLAPSYHTPTSSRLTDIRGIDPKTDQAKWLAWLANAALNRRHISVMHAADIHFPFQDDAAVEMFMQLAAHVQPDVIVVGSDAHDMAGLSSFPKDPDVNTGDFDDELDLVEYYWHDFITKLRAACPNSKLVFIYGNHERRLITNIVKNAPSGRKTVWKRFVEIIRHYGDVLYLGETDRVRLGPLLVQHGAVAGKHAALAMLEKSGFQVSVMAGHVHRATMFSKAGEDYSVHAMTSGCLCSLQAHYDRGVRTYGWIHGTGFAEVDLQGREVSMQHIPFTVTGDELTARFERKQFAVKVERKARVS